MYNKLRLLRKKLNISVSKICLDTGIEPKGYYKRELGKIKFSLDEAKKISNIFKMSIEDIFFDEQLSKIENYYYPNYQGTQPDHITEEATQQL